MKAEKIYLLSHDIQEKEIEKICYGKCKKIIFSTVWLGTWMMAPCGETDCPWLDKEEPTGELDDLGREIVIRKIRMKK